MPRSAPQATTLAIAGLLLASCGGGGDDGDAAPRTVPTAAGPTTTTDPYAIPPVIDEAYVNRVLEALDAAVGDIFRIVVSTRDIPPELIDRLHAVYLDRDDMNLQLMSLQKDLRFGFDGIRPNPGNVRSTVAETIQVSPRCIYVRLNRDYSQISSKSSSEPSVEWIGLKPAEAGRNPNFNPTPWMVAVEGLRADGTAPPSPCEAS